jgi:hypothetical protein
MKTMLDYIALEFWIQLSNFVSWAKILGNVLPRCWRCDITVFTLPLKSYGLLVIHMLGCPFPNLKLTYTPPRAKYEWKELLYHAYTFVDHGLWSFGPPWWRPVTTSTPWFPLYPWSWNVPGSCSFPLCNEREGAPIGHAYTSHYGDPHSEEGDHPTSTSGPFEKQWR